MANYDANKKATQLDTLTALASDDVVVVGDTSDSGKAKAITKTNLKTEMEAGLVNATATDTTASFLDNKIEITSDDSSVTVTKTIQNSGANEKIIYDLSVTSTTGGGSGLSKLSQTFTFSDFTNVSGDGVATFTSDMPADAVPVGVVYEITSAFDSTFTLTVRDVNAGTIIGGEVDADAVATLTGETDGNNTNFDFTTNPNPVVITTQGVPTQGTVTVTILYSTTEVTSSDLAMTQPLSGVTGVASIGMSSNTTMTVGRVYIPEKITVSTVSVVVPSRNADGVLAFALYSSDGLTRYISDVTPTINSDTTTPYTVSITPVTLNPGQYYTAFHTNGSANLNVEHSILDTDLQGFSGVSGKALLAGTLTITASTTPATIDPTAITVGNNVPLMRFDA